MDFQSRRLPCRRVGPPDAGETAGGRRAPSRSERGRLLVWNHASLPFGGSSTWVLNVVGEIVPSLIRLGTIVSYHFKIQTIVDGHCVVM